MIRYTDAYNISVRRKQKKRAYAYINNVINPYMEAVVPWLLGVKNTNGDIREYKRANFQSAKNWKNVTQIHLTRDIRRLQLTRCGTRMGY